MVGCVGALAAAVTPAMAADMPRSFPPEPLPVVERVPARFFGSDGTALHLSFFSVSGATLLLGCFSDANVQHHQDPAPIPGGRIHEPHGVGFPLLIAPAWAVGGAKAAVERLAVATVAVVTDQTDFPREKSGPRRPFARAPMSTADLGD